MERSYLDMLPPEICAKINKMVDLENWKDRMVVLGPQIIAVAKHIQHRTAELFDGMEPHYWILSKTRTKYNKQCGICSAVRGDGVMTPPLWMRDNLRGRLGTPREAKFEICSSCSRSLRNRSLRRMFKC